MQKEWVDGASVRQLRTLFRLNRTQAAQLSGLSVAQVEQLEDGGWSTFESPHSKIQSAMQFSRALSGVQKNGLPRVNVVKGWNPPPVPSKPKRPVQVVQKFEYRTNPMHLFLIAMVILFLFVVVAVPVMSDRPIRRQPGDIWVPATWRQPSSI